MAVKVALDWSPNTNHTGFYVARAKGWYQDAGLNVSFLSPHEDHYKSTPASHLSDGSATFACVPSESKFDAVESRARACIVYVAWLHTVQQARNGRAWFYKVSTAVLAVQQLQAQHAVVVNDATAEMATGC